MRIPITMCHGIDEVHSPDKPLTKQRFDALISIADEMGFASIDYKQLDDWWAGRAGLPERPIMFDFDHPVRSMRYEMHDVLSKHGYAGNLFINTAPMVAMNDELLAKFGPCMSWDEIGELIEAGWHIGAHTVTHPNLSELSLEDPMGVSGADGGPPLAARYITREMDPYLLPSMELQALVHEPANFRRYLEDALET